MEKELVQGSLGDIKVTLSGGKAKLEAQGALPGGVGVTAGAFLECDASALLDKIFAEIEAKSPAGAVPLEEAVKLVIKQAVAAL